MYCCKPARLYERRSGKCWLRCHPKTREKQELACNITSCPCVHVWRKRTIRNILSPLKNQLSQAFQRVKPDERKVQLDDRFKAVLTDPRFQVSNGERNVGGRIKCTILV